MSRAKSNRSEGNRNFSEMITCKKIPVFKQLYDALVLHHGSANKLDLKTGCCKGAMTGAFKNKRLSVYYAKIILAEFNNIKKIKRGDS